jgi:hypothetical protein
MGSAERRSPGLSRASAAADSRKAGGLGVSPSFTLSLGEVGGVGVIRILGPRSGSDFACCPRERRMLP